MGIIMKIIQIKDEFIKLGQALKLAGAVDSGLDAKVIIQEGQVKVNNNIDTRRGRKLYHNDTIEYKGAIYKISGETCL